MKSISVPHLALAIAWLLVSVASAGSAVDPMLQDKQWIHGSENCATNSDPAIEVYSHSPTSFILRQDKCLSFEAPFICVLIGDERALLLGTGATEAASEFPLYDSVRALIGDNELLVLHSHGHGDHRSAYVQFKNVPGVTLVGTQQSAPIRRYR